MKCILLAGGYAKRLWPLTKKKAKPLLPVCGKLIIDHLYENLKRAGVSSIIVSTNALFAPQFEEWASGKDVKIVVEETRSEEEKLGALRALLQVFEKEGIDEDCMVIGADNVFPFEMKEFISAFDSNFLVALHDVKSLERARNYGVMQVENGVVTDFEEKPQNPKSTLASTACYIYPKKAISVLREYLSEGGNKDAPGHFLEWLYKKETVKAFVFGGEWFDVGDLKGCIEANKGGWVDPEAIIENSTVEHCVIMKNARIKDCELSGCVVGEGVCLEGEKRSDEIIAQP